VDFKMTEENLKIGSEVYQNIRFSNDSEIGKIVGETPQYWKIQFGNSVDLYSKQGLFLRGADKWSVRHCSLLTEEKKNKILEYRELQTINSKINNFFRNGIIIKNINNGKKILELIENIKELEKC